MTVVNGPVGEEINQMMVDLLIRHYSNPVVKW